MEAACESPLAEAEAHGPWAASGCHPGGRAVVHLVRLCDNRSSWQEVLPKANPKYLFNLNLYPSAALSQQ